MCQLNNQAYAQSDDSLPWQEQVASVEILIRQQMVHIERILADMHAATTDLESLTTESRDFDSRGINADQIPHGASWAMPWPTAACGFSGR